MKVAIITDTHLGARNDSLVFSDYFYRFFDNVFFPHLEQNGITRLLHLGDLVDRRKYVNFHTLNRMRVKFIERLEDMGVQTDLIVGNHDTFYKNTNSLNGVTELFGKNVKNLRIHTDPIEIDLGGLSVALVPWITRENADATQKFLESSRAVMCMGHFELTGFQVLRGVKSEKGLDPAVLQRFETVLSGHFHHKHDDGHIFYLGAPYQITFSDLGDSKGFHILDTETRELEFIENPYRMFHKVAYNDSEYDYDTNPVDYTRYKDGYVKLVVLRKTKPYTFDKFLDGFYAAGAASVQIIEDINDLEINKDEVLDMSQDTLSLIHGEIDSLPNIPHPARLKDLMHRLYVEALEQE